MKKLIVALLCCAGTAFGQIAQFGQPISPEGSTALEASRVLRNRPASLISLTITDTTDEYILIINATSVPANGAVTLLFPPIHVSANSTTMINFSGNPLSASTGIVVCNSSTGTFTKTLGGSTCIFKAQLAQ